MSVVTHAGNAPLNDRWVLTFIPGAAEVTFTNAAEDEPPLKFTGVGGFSEVVVNGRSRVVLADTVAHPEIVKAGSGWPCLVPGAQTVTVTGSSNWSLTFKNLYL
jgi:hypothetical protein